MVKFVDSNKVSEAQAKTGSTNSSKSSRSSSLAYTTFNEIYGADFEKNYEDLSKFLKTETNSKKLRFAELANKVGLLDQWLGFVDDAEIVDLAGFRNVMNEHFRANIKGTNLHEQTFQEIINTMAKDFGDSKIRMPYSNEMISVKEAIASGNLNLFINSPEFKNVMKDAIHSMVDPRSAEMQEYKQLAEEMPPEMLTRFSIGKQAFKAGLSYQVLRQSYSLGKTWGYDTFSGKNAFNKAIKGNLGTKATLEALRDSADEFADAKVKNLSGEAARKELGIKEKDWKKKSKRAKTMAKNKAARSLKLKHKASYLKNLDADEELKIIKRMASKADVAGNASKLGGFNKAARATRYADDAARASLTAVKTAKAAKAAKKAGQAVGWLRKIKLAWTAGSGAFKAAGLAGGPVGLAVTLLGGFALDLVIGEGIDAVSVMANGGELTEENKKAWIPVGEWAGQALHSWLGWVRA